VSAAAPAPVSAVVGCACTPVAIVCSALSHHFISFVSDFGDTAVTLPFAAILALFLGGVQSPASSATALRSLALCLGAMVLLKVAFITCGRHWDIGLVSPSGHAAISLTVYGMAAMVLASWTAGWWRMSLAVAAAALVAAIAVSRVLLGVHTVTEVVVGLLVGAAALWVFAASYLWPAKPRPGRANLFFLGLALVVPLAALHGERLPAERWVRQAAVMLRTNVGVCRALPARSEIVGRPRPAVPSA